LLNQSGSGELRLNASGATAGKITAYTAGSERLRIDTTGNVGIGTTSPYAKLSVEHLSTTGTVIGTDALTGFTGNLLDLKVASSSKFTINYLGNITTAGTFAPSGVGVNMIVTSDASGVLVSSSTPTAANYLATSTTATSTFAGGMSVAGTAGLTVLQGGNVGIGTAAPVDKFTILSASSGGDVATRITNNTTGANSTASLKFSVTAPTYTSGAIVAHRTPSNDLSFWTDGSERMRILGVSGSITGNVGIGTTSPDQLLSLYSATTPSLEFSSASGPTNKWTMGIDTADANKFKISSSTAVGTSPRLTIDGNGNVGIGTASPDQKLSVNGSANFQQPGQTGFGINMASNNGTANGRISVLSPIANDNFILNTKGTGWLGVNYDSGTGGFRVFDGAATTLSFFSGSAGSSFINATGGNVGIGTTTPSTLLHILSPADTADVITWGGSIGTAYYNWGKLGINLSTNTLYLADTYTGTGNIQFRIGGNTVTETKMTIKSTGNVGIGTTTPNWFLQVAGTRPSLALSDTSQTAVSNLQHWLFSSMGGNLYIGTSTGAYATSTPAALTILNSGYVGVGTTTPWRTLGVTGTVGFDGLTASTTIGDSLCLSNLKEVTLAVGRNCATASSLRFKRDISPLSAESGLAEVMALNPVSFLYKSDYLGAFASEPNWNGEHVGFIAEEVQKVDPRLVTLDQEGKPDTVRYEILTSILAKAIQEQQTEIDKLAGSFASTTIIDQIATSTAARIVADQSFIAQIAQAVKSLIDLTGDWVVAKITSALAVFTRVETQTMAISNGLEMTDQATGQIYCVTIKNGDWSKVLGACQIVASAALSTPANAAPISTATTPAVTAPVVTIMNPPATTTPITDTPIINSPTITPDSGTPVATPAVVPTSDATPVISSTPESAQASVPVVESAAGSISTPVPTTESAPAPTPDSAPAPAPAPAPVSAAESAPAAIN
jgi:hypothetical protein